MQIAQPDETILLQLSISDNATPANNPVTGQTATVCWVRQSDQAFYNFSTAAWTARANWAAVAAAEKAALTDTGLGCYTKTLDLSTAMAGAVGNYVAIYYIAAGAYACMVHEQWRIRAISAQSGITVASATSATAVDETALRIIKGDPVTITHTCTDSTGAAVNITGHTLYFTLRTSKNATGATDTDATVQKAAVVTNGASGICTVTLATTDTDDLDIGTTYYWDLCDITGGHVTYARGTLRALWHTTLRTS